jgi:predicted AlkP superfamily pyrophosphatase or phosphodiesterase
MGANEFSSNIVILVFLSFENNNQESCGRMGGLPEIRRIWLWQEREFMRHFIDRIRERTWPVLAILVLSVTFCSAQSTSSVVEVPNPPNAPAQQARHYVILVSLDGFRYDYAARYGAKNLQALAARGASAPGGMIPSYPSITFPNHWTIVTGLYPEHHGIVANNFYDPVRNEKYAFTDSKSNGDGSWYGGVPLWVLAEQQGMRSACFFWPGSEAEIQGKRPSYYLHFDDTFPDEKRVEQILAWLRLPADKRPHFMTLYYSNVDHAGHNFGPDAPETGAAVLHLDEVIGKLADGIAATGLPVDMIVLADHGMETTQGGWVSLDKWVDLSQVETSGPLLYTKSDAEAEKVYKSLLGVSGDFKVYRRAQVPAHLHLNSNPREGDPVIVSTGPYTIVAHDPSSGGNVRTPPRGNHGYDSTTMPSMKAIFYAAGPDIRAGATLAPFENVDIYPLIAKILGLRTGTIDGHLRALQPILAKHSQN